MKTARRRPWLSFLLSLLLPGLGQVYNGEFLKGIFFYLLSFLLGLGLLFSPLHFFAAFGLIFLIRILVCSEAVFRAARKKAEHPLERYQRWYVYLLLFLAGVVGGHFGYRGLMPPIEVSGVSMEPTLLSGDIALANRVLYWFRGPRPGEVVVFENPRRKGGYLVKRVVAAGGQKVTLRGGEITVDDGGVSVPARRDVPSPDGTYQRRKADGTKGRSWDVPEGSLFVVSDNRSRAADSRYYGPVPMNTVKAKLLKIYWSWDKKRERVRWDRIGKGVKQREIIQ